MREKDYVISSVVATISMENNFSLKSLFLVPLSAIVFGGIVASVDMSPSSLTLQVGAITPIQATARDANGQVIQGVVFQWLSRNVNVATVDQTGNVTGVAIGTIKIVATAPNGVQTLNAPPFLIDVALKIF